MYLLAVYCIQYVHMTSSRHLLSQSLYCIYTRTIIYVLRLCHATFICTCIYIYTYSYVYMYLHLNCSTHMNKFDASPIHLYFNFTYRQPLPPWKSQPFRKAHPVIGNTTTPELGHDNGAGSIHQLHWANSTLIPVTKSLVGWVRYGDGKTTQLYSGHISEAVKQGSRI